jgi:hypothetical protein
VAIDWTKREVHVDGHVVLRRGPIEYLACRPGKEHESIILIDASAMHIYMALGLIGLEPGHPPQWQEDTGRFKPPSGDLVDVAVEWEVDGSRRRVPAVEWMREFTFGRTPIDRPWVFAGSRPLRDGTLAADHTGDGIAVVDKPDSLLALSRTHADRNAELWAIANTDAIPPVQTRVRVILRPARPREHVVHVDFRGVAYVDHRYACLEDLADLIELARRLTPDYVQQIHLVGPLHADVNEIQSRLTSLGLPGSAVRFKRSAAAPQAEPAVKP